MSFQKQSCDYSVKSPVNHFSFKWHSCKEVVLKKTWQQAYSSDVKLFDLQYCMALYQCTAFAASSMFLLKGLNVWKHLLSFALSHTAAPSSSHSMCCDSCRACLCFFPQHAASQPDRVPISSIIRLLASQPCQTPVYVHTSCSSQHKHAFTVHGIYPRTQIQAHTWIKRQTKALIYFHTFWLSYCAPKYTSACIHAYPSVP